MRDPLAASLDRLSAAPDDAVARAQDLLLGDLLYEIDQLKTAVEGPTGPVTVEGLPQELKADWIAPSGEARLVAAPRGDARDLTMLQRFVDAVRRVAPDATGAAVTVVEAGRTVASAFTRALALAAVASAALLFAVLRRPRDVALVLAPLALAGVLTAAVWTAAGNALNFANIIALPLMLGIGVAFNIYFVVNWRSGHGGPLQSSLARAIVVSALTTMTAFGSLAATPHLGIRSMGELLALALGFTVLTALLVLPALLGPPPRAA